MTRSSSGKQRDALEDGRGELGELAIGLDESVEGLGAVFDDAEAALEIALQNGDGRRLRRGSWRGRGAGGGRGFRSVGGFRENARAQAAGDRLNRREGVGNFVADDADETTPGEAFFFAEGGADVGEHDERVRDAALAEGGAADHPALGLAGVGAAGARKTGAGELELDGGFAGLVEKAGEVEVGDGFAEVARGEEGEDALGSGIEEAEACVLIEGEDGGVHFGDDAAEEGDSFERADALGLEGVSEGVDFEGKLADGVVAIGATRAEGVVLLAEGGNDVGEGLDGADGFFNEGGEDEEQDEKQDAQGGEHRSGGDVKQGEDGGREAEENERADGAEDAETRLKGDALAFGFASLGVVRHGFSDQ